MGNSDSVPVPLKPEMVQSLMEEVRDSNQEMLKEIENIKVNHEQEMKKKDELQKETERSWNEVNWELEEVTEQNRQNEAELKRIKEESRVKDELQKETERSLNEVKWELEEMKEQKRQEETEMELKFSVLQKQFDELNESHAKAQASLELVELRASMDEITKDLLRMEVEELTDYKDKSLKEENLLKQQIKDYKNKNLKEEELLRKQVAELKFEIAYLKFENRSIKDKSKERVMKRLVADLKMENTSLQVQNNDIKHENWDSDSVE